MARPFPPLVQEVPGAGSPRPPCSGRLRMKSASRKKARSSEAWSAGSAHDLVERSAHAGHPGVALYEAAARGISVTVARGWPTRASSSARDAPPTRRCLGNDRPPTLPRRAISKAYRWAHPTPTASPRSSPLGLAHRARLPRRRRALLPRLGAHALGRGRHGPHPSPQRDDPVTPASPRTQTPALLLRPSSDASSSVLLRAWRSQRPIFRAVDYANASMYRGNSSVPTAIGTKKRANE